MFDEENNEIIPEEKPQEEQTVSEEPIQEAVEPVNPYRQMSEEDYKESIKQMKQEYKQFQKDKKQAEKQQREAYQEAYAQNGFNYNSHKGVGTIKTVLISLISSLVVFSFIFALLAFSTNLSTKSSSTGSSDIFLTSFNSSNACSSIASKFCCC